MLDGWNRRSRLGNKEQQRSGDADKLHKVGASPATFVPQSQKQRQEEITG